MEVVSLAGGFIQRGPGMPKERMTVAKYRLARTALVIETPDPAISVVKRSEWIVAVLVSL